MQYLLAGLDRLTGLLLIELGISDAATVLTVDYAI